MTEKRVAVAMSRGMDSSVAAALLLEQGYDVVGITVAAKLGINHYPLDLNIKKR